MLPDFRKSILKAPRVCPFVLLVKATFSWRRVWGMCGMVQARENRSRADSHYTSRFRSVEERHRSVNLSHVCLNGYVHTDRTVSVKSQFRSVAERECWTGRNGSEPVWTSSIMILWTVQCPRPVRFECLAATSAVWFFFGNGWKINRIGA